jgi:hypothetical protein
VSDNHRGLPHDLPDYVPNLPLAADVRRQMRGKVRVYKRAEWWSWSHTCPDGTVGQTCIPDHPYALQLALSHLEWCR